jgi:hypothetical protein
MNTEYIIKVSLGLFLLFALFEIIIIGIAFFNADKVECNLLWCTFTTEYKRNINQECYQNGIMINCSEISSFYDNDFFKKHLND